MTVMTRLAADDAEILTAQAQLIDPTGRVRPELTATEADAILRHVNAARYDNGWGPLDMEGRIPTVAADAEWLTIGTQVVPPARRAAFLAAIEAQRWVEPNGSHPFSPGYSLRAVIEEFSIIPVVAVSYNVPWYVPDGPETATYSVLGVRTRKQRLVFVDGGCAVTPVVILPVGA